MCGARQSPILKLRLRIGDCLPGQAGFTPSLLPSQVFAMTGFFAMTGKLKEDCFTPSHFPSQVFAMTVRLYVIASTERTDFAAGRSNLHWLLQASNRRLPTGQAGFTPLLVPSRILAMTVYSMMKKNRQVTRPDGSSTHFKKLYNCFPHSR